MQINTLSSSLSQWLKVHCSNYLLYGLSLPRQLYVAPLQMASAFIHSYDTFESRAIEEKFRQQSSFSRRHLFAFQILKK